MINEYWNESMIQKINNYNWLIKQTTNVQKNER